MIRTINIPIKLDQLIIHICICRQKLMDRIVQVMNDMKQKNNKYPESTYKISL